MGWEMSRREYLRTAASAAGAVGLLSTGCVRHRVAAAVIPRGANEKLSLAVVGGGMGSANAKALADLGENVVALCDVDRGRLDGWARGYPGAKTYTDFRKMLETEKLDGVVVATPDHTHAVISITAMKLGVHCFCQKPMTYCIQEARAMAKVAAATRRITQLGTQTCTGLANTQAKALMQSGILGDVTEIHVWTDRPIWPQGFSRPPGEDPVPSNLDWDLWLGPAPARPFVAKWPEGHPMYELPKELRHSQVYHPFVWRGWWDFGTGALGDIASHSLNQVWWNLELDAPVSAEVVESSGPTGEMYPLSCVLRLNFPARHGRAPLSIVWYDGGKRPPEEIGGQSAAGGVVYIGTKNSFPKGRGPFRGKEFEYQMPSGEFSERPDIHKDWCDGIRSGQPPPGNFGYAAPLTEAILLGNIALKVGQKIEWDAKAMRVTNCKEANQYVSREYRRGWEL